MLYKQNQWMKNLSCILVQRLCYTAVGGGTAGCVLANRLSEDPDVSVLLLEAGKVPDDPFASVPLTFYNAWTNPTIDWGYYTEPQKNTVTKKPIKWLQAKMLGGGSSYDSMQANRGSPHDYDSWERFGIKGWAYKDLLPYFRKSENMLDPQLLSPKKPRKHFPSLKRKARTTETKQQGEFFTNQRRRKRVSNARNRRQNALKMTMEDKQHLEDTLETSFYESTEVHGVGGPIDIKLTDRNPVTEKFIKAAEKVGFLEVIDINGPNIEGGFGQGQIDVNKKGLRASTYEGYLKPVLGRHNLDVVTQAFVFKVGIKYNKTDGVYFSFENKVTYVKASKEVIISAGAINSPKILMLSGIGPKKSLDKMKINVIADLPVGKELHDVQGVVLPLSLDPESNLAKRKIDAFQDLFEYVFTGKGIWSDAGSSITMFQKSKTQPPEDLFPYVGQVININTVHVDKELSTSIQNGSGIIPELVKKLGESLNKVQLTGKMFVALNHPRKSGTITLRNIDPYENPVINYNYLTDKRDIADVIEGIRRYQTLLNTRILRDAGVLPITDNGPLCSSFTFDSDDYWNCYARAAVWPFYIYSGTCRMAKGKQGVVDDKLRVKGVKGLRVADLSIVPTAPSGGGYIPVIMIAEKAADMIMANLK